MASEDSEVEIYNSIDEFYERHGFPPMHRITFDRSKVNQSELETITRYFSNLCIDLTIYDELFTDQNSIDILNKFNNLIFGRIQKAYVEKICLCIACLLDSAETGKNKNLSLARIINQCECSELDEKYSKLQDLYTETGIKNWRRKLLAHNDLGTLMGTKPLELKLNHHDIFTIVELMQEIISDISDPTVHTDISFVLPYDKNGKTFLKKLSYSLKNDA